MGKLFSKQLAGLGGAARRFLEKAGRGRDEAHGLGWDASARADLCAAEGRGDCSEGGRQREGRVSVICADDGPGGEFRRDGAESQAESGGAQKNQGIGARRVSLCCATWDGI